MRCIQRIPNSSAKGSTKAWPPSPLLVAPHHVFVCCHMCCVHHLGPWPPASLSPKHLLMAFRNSPVPGKSLHPHYLWVLWPALPFVVIPVHDLGSLLQKFVSKPKLTPKTLASGSLSKSQASPFLLQDMITEIKCPQNPLICACMLPLDCPPWFWMLALLSECVTCHECHRGKETKFQPCSHVGG